MLDITQVTPFRAQHSQAGTTLRVRPVLVLSSMIAMALLSRRKFLPLERLNDGWVNSRVTGVTRAAISVVGHVNCRPPANSQETPSSKPCRGRRSSLQYPRGPPKCERPRRPSQ